MDGIGHGKFLSSENLKTWLLPKTGRTKSDLPYPSPALIAIHDAPFYKSFTYSPSLTLAAGPSIERAAMIMPENRINIRSLFAWPDKKYPGIHQLVIRVSAQVGARTVSLLKESGFEVITEYVEGLRPHLPTT